VKTNVIGAARVTERNANDAPQFSPLVLAGAERFHMKEIVADKAYGSRKNVALAAAVGATPYIALRSTAQASAMRVWQNPGAQRDSTAWRWLYHLYNLRRDDFLAHYHARSNVESTFSAIKRVFGDTLRSKTRPAQINELLLKVIAYNIVCVVHSTFELGVSVPGFDAAA